MVTFLDEFVEAVVVPIKDVIVVVVASMVMVVCIPVTLVEIIQLFTSLLNYLVDILANLQIFYRSLSEH